MRAPQDLAKPSRLCVPSEPTFRLEVIVRQEGLELTNGTARIATIPTVNGEYDLKTLSELALSLKRDHPDVDSASVLLEAEVKYDSLIQVMDAIRSTELPATDASLAGQAVAASPTDASAAAAAEPTKVALFTKIAVGDAP